MRPQQLHHCLATQRAVLGTREQESPVATSNPFLSMHLLAP
jgi:hypothetical protein